MSFKFKLALFALAAPFAALNVAAQVCVPAADHLSLADAIMRAQSADLRPEAAREAIRASRTERAIAALRPEDSLSLEAENFPGLGDSGNIDNLEITGRFSRVWERGGKRDARLALADSAADIAAVGVLEAEAAIANEVRQLYIEAWSAEQRLALSRVRLSSAEAAESLIDKRVKAARDPLLAGSRARTDSLVAKAQVADLEADVAALKGALAGFWLGDSAFTVGACGLQDPGSHGTHETLVGDTPALKRIEAERRLAAARQRVAEAGAVPDVTWSAGVRKFGIEDNLAILGGVSVPLGTPKRSAAEADRDRAAQLKLGAEAEALRQQQLREAVQAERVALNAADALERIDTDAIPEAERSVDLAREGYVKGAFSYLEVLDAERVLFDLRAQRIDFIRTYHLAEAALARLSGDTTPSSHSE